MDVVALGNLCVDILLPHGPIPPPGQVKSEAMLAQLTTDNPPQSIWEVGGSCNALVLVYCNAFIMYCHALIVCQCSPHHPPYFTSDSRLLSEVARQYMTWR